MVHALAPDGLLIARRSGATKLDMPILPWHYAGERVFVHMGGPRRLDVSAGGSASLRANRCACDGTLSRFWIGKSDDLRDATDGSVLPYGRVHSRLSRL